jgi:hypothetical protein
MQQMYDMWFLKMAALVYKCVKYENVTSVVPKFRF